MADVQSVPIDPYAEPGVQKIPERVFWVTSAIAELFDREYYFLILTREFFFYLIFLFSVTFAAVVKMDSMTYVMTDAVKSQLLKTQFKAGVNQDIYFHEITTIGQLYDYLNEIVAMKIFKESFSDLEPTSASAATKDRGLLYYNRLLSQPTIRQVLSNNATCHSFIKGRIKECYAVYSRRNSYRENLEGTGTATKYAAQLSRETRATTYWGKVAYYEAGGYYTRLGTTQKEFREKLTRLKMEAWLKERSRAVFLDMQFYNPHVDLFSVVKLIFEMPPTGQIIPTASITTFQCDKDYTRKIVRVADGFTIIYTAFIIYYLAEEIRQLFFFKYSYFLLSFTWPNLVIIATSLTHFIYFWTEKSKCAEYLEEYKGSTNNFYPLQQVAYLENISVNMQGIAIYFIYFKLLKFLCLNRSLARLHYTLRSSNKYLTYLFFLWLIVMFAFTATGFLLFGTQVDGFSTVGTSLYTLLRAFVGEFSYAEVSKYHCVWGPIYLTAFIIMMFFIVVHLFLAVLSSTYTEVKTDMGIMPQRIQLYGFWGRGCANCFNDCGCGACVPRKLQRKRYSATAEEIRAILKLCGFSHIDIDMFMQRYNIDPTQEIRRRDVSKLIENIRIPTMEIPPKRPHRTTLVPEKPSGKPPAPTQSTKEPLLSLDDFTRQQERLDRVENIMSTIAEKLEKLLKMMNTLDQKRAMVSPGGRGRGRGRN